MSIAEKLTTIAENEQKVYDAGKKDEYDAFWDIVQEKGKRKNYQTSFAGYTWNDENFKPKYNIIPIGNMNNMFFETQITDLVKILEDCGIIFDTSNGTTFNYFMAYSKITNAPIIDSRNTTITKPFTNFCYAAKALKSIKLILKDDGSQSFEKSYAFFNCLELENFIIEGTIGQDGFNVQYSTKLSKASILSILRALKDTGEPLYTVTLSKVAVDKAFETSPGANDGSESPEWYSITNQGGAYWWTISLV